MLPIADRYSTSRTESDGLNGDLPAGNFSLGESKVQPTDAIRITLHDGKVAHADRRVLEAEPCQRMPRRRFLRANRVSPSLPMFGAYFPFWLACMGAGVIGAVVLRVLFIRLGIDEVLPWRLLVYACCAATIGIVMALTVYGR